MQLGLVFSMDQAARLLNKGLNLRVGTNVQEYRQPLIRSDLYLLCFDTTLRLSCYEST